MSSKIVSHKNTSAVRSAKSEQLYPLEVEDPDDLANFPPDQVVSGEQLKMKPGQSLAQKARELGVTQPTLRLWHVEWRGSGYDPEYRIRRAGHSNWLKNKWKDKDWTALLRAQIAKGQHRHVGDLCLELGMTASNAQVWSQKYVEFAKLLWAEPHPKNLWPRFLGYVRHGTIARYQELKAGMIADGIDETTAAHQAGDLATGELRHKTAQRRRVERDQLLGVGGHETEILRRYRKGSRLTDAHSRRLAKKLFQISRYAVMERALRETGHDEADIKEKIATLMGAFAKSEPDGQAQWKRTRGAVLQRRAAADAMQKAEEVEAEAIKLLPGLRAAKYVKRRVEQKYGRDGLPCNTDKR